MQVNFLAPLKKLVKHWPVIDQIRRLRYRRVYGKMPLVVNLELTTKCNARCRMCPHPESDFEKKVMAMETLEKVLDGLAGTVAQGTILYPVGLGEPLLNPALHEMNRRISARYPRARIHYNTNGILLGHSRSRAFLDFAHRIVVSLNSPDAEKYRTLMGVDKHAEVTAALKGFLHRRRDHPRFRDHGFPHVTIQMMGLDAYASDFAAFQAEWRPFLEAGDTIHFNPMDNWGGKIPDPDLYTRKRSARYPCGSLWRMVTIDVDGAVFPCCVPLGTRNGKSIELGNALTRPLSSILADGKLEELKRIHLRGKAETLEACRNCDVYRVDPNIRFKNPFTGHWV